MVHFPHGGGPRSPRPTEPTPPELRNLRYFIAVAEDSSSTRAAARLFIAQPSLSAAIRQLVRQLGVVLLTRDSRHVALTPAGEALLPHASEAIASVERGVRAAQAAAESRLEVLRVLYTHRLEPVSLEALDRLEASDPPVPVTAHGVWAGEWQRYGEVRRAVLDQSVKCFAEVRSEKAHRFKGKRGLNAGVAVRSQ